MEFMAVRALVAGGGLWPPPPNPVGMGVQIRTLEKGLTHAQIVERLGLAGATPGMVVGTTISHTFAYDIGRTHTLHLHFGRGKDGWEIHTADLRASTAEPGTAEVEWPVSWPKAAKP